MKQKNGPGFVFSTLNIIKGNEKTHFGLLQILLRGTKISSLVASVIFRAEDRIE